ncbi:MlaD family protein [Nocardia vaccinii]|uniref:MlaD family protein n=1 Tax=Nocardia vaccinii TaxID=1822 RepID=UPI00082F1D57|nr:MlaD family protein [Nocardia vaccinii]
MRLRIIGFASITLVFITASCGFNPSEHAMPGTGVGGPTYRLNIEFTSLLSLPAGAEIRSDGTKVGSVRSIGLTSNAAVAHADIGSSVRLPRGTRAELRQTTVLGDIYLALLPPNSAATAALLHDGDTIPLRDTFPGPQVEDMLQRIATFVDGGSITRLQDAITRLNQVLPDDPAQTRALTASAVANLRDAAADTADLDRTLAATAELSRRLHDMRDRLGFVFSDTARTRLERVPQFMTAVLNVVIDINTLTTGLAWLIPRLPHIDDFLDTLGPLLRQPSAHATELNGNASSAIILTRDKLIPFLLGPNIDIRRVSLNGRGDATKDAVVLLQLIGAVR